MFRKCVQKYICIYFAMVMYMSILRAVFFPYYTDTDRIPIINANLKFQENSFIKCERVSDHHGEFILLSAKVSKLDHT